MSLSSHPSRGAWIERLTWPRLPRSPLRRTPHGVRGLKVNERALGLLGVGSHPSRGAWIERALILIGGCGGSSHPSRGAWIERPTARYPPACSACRTPHGVRGLKASVGGGLWVSVEWSHPSRGAWIESKIPVRVRQAVRSRTPHGVRGLKDLRRA